MIMDSFLYDEQIEEFSYFDMVEEMCESIRETCEDDWSSYYDDDQALEEFSLECAYGPEEY